MYTQTILIYIKRALDTTSLQSQSCFLSKTERLCQGAASMQQHGSGLDLTIH